MNGYIKTFVIAGLAIVGFIVVCILFANSFSRNLKDFDNRIGDEYIVSREIVDGERVFKATNSQGHTAYSTISPLHAIMEIDKSTPSGSNSQGEDIGGYEE